MDLKQKLEQIGNKKPEKLWLMCLWALIAISLLTYLNVESIKKGELCGALYDFQQTCSNQNNSLMCVTPASGLTGTPYGNQSFIVSRTNQSDAT